MWIDKLAIYKYDTLYNNGKNSKKLKLCNHLINEDSMDTKKFVTLLADLRDAWECSYKDVQVQVRFVPEGTDIEDK